MNNFKWALKEWSDIEKSRNDWKKTKEKKKKEDLFIELFLFS